MATFTTTSNAGRSLIEAFEGLFLKTYDDGEGVMTIGYGHTTAAGLPKVIRGMTISAAEADRILTNDLKPCEETVKRLIKMPLSQNEGDALTSFEFNTGDLAKSSIPAKINSGNRKAAMDTLMQYVHGANSGKAYAGLLRRRKAERLMFIGDVHGSLVVAGVTDVSDAMPKASPPSVVKLNPIPVTDAPKTSWLAALLSIFTRNKT